MPIPDRAISLIICTRNRRDSLEVCLQYIASVEFPASSWELILVDNGSTDDTLPRIERFAQTAAFPVLIVQETRQGLSHARNAGVAKSSGQVIAFTDDDCYVAHDFLQQLWDAFQDRELGYLGGRILLHDPTDAALTIREDEEPVVIPPYSFVEPGLIQGANLAFRREVVEQIGGFDPQLGPGTSFICDDLEFVARASSAGWQGGYCPGPVVEHHHGRKPGSEINQLKRAYDAGVGAYFSVFLLNRSTRRTYLTAWLSMMIQVRRQGPGISSRLRNIAGAMRYLLHRLRHKRAIAKVLSSSTDSSKSARTASEYRATPIHRQADGCGSPE